MEETTLFCDQYDTVSEEETILKAVERLSNYWVTLVEKHGVIAVDKPAFRSVVERIDFVFSVEYAYLVAEVYENCEAQYLKQLLHSDYTGQRRLNGLLTCALRRYMNVESCQNRNYVGFCEFIAAFLKKEQVSVAWQLRCFQHRDDFFHAHMNHVYRFAKKPTPATTRYPLSYFRGATALQSSIGAEN